MATTLTFYNKFKKYIADGTIDLDTNTIKVALVTSAYTPDPAHDVLADVLASPSPEVVPIASPDNGYDAGGAALTGQAVTHTDSPSQAVFDADNLTWSLLTATFRYGIIYASGTLNGILNPLIGYLLFNDAPADISIAGINFTIQWNAGGIITIG
jgi:hypothetical protein